MKFRNKPVVIEAWPVDMITNMYFSDPEVPQAIRDAANAGIYIHLGQGKADIKTPEGMVRVTSGDWIVKGVNNELYPCKSDVFYATYEPVRKEELQTQDQDVIKAQSSKSRTLLEETQAELQERLEEAVKWTSALRQVFDMQAITVAELYTQLSGEPTIIIEKMLGVEAASISLDGKRIRTFPGPRYPVTFEHVCSEMDFLSYNTGPIEETCGFLPHQENLGLFQITQTICERTGQVISGVKRSIEKFAKILEDIPNVFTIVAASDVFDDLNLKEAVWLKPIKVIRDEKAFSRGKVGLYLPRHLVGQVYFLKDAYIQVGKSVYGMKVKQCETLGIGIDNIKSMWMVKFDD